MIEGSGLTLMAPRKGAGGAPTPTPTPTPTPAFFGATSRTWGATAPTFGGQ